MGVCLSCLGLSRKDNSEHSRLLDTEDPFSQYANYGSTGQPAPPPPQEEVNPEDARREREALDGITNWTTHNVVDVWTRQPTTSIIPGDKDHKARIYPSSRPQSQESESSFTHSSHIKHVNGSSKAKVDEVPLVRTLKMEF